MYKSVKFILMSFALVLGGAVHAETQVREYEKMPSKFKKDLQRVQDSLPSLCEGLPEMSSLIMPGFIPGEMITRILIDKKNRSMYVEQDGKWTHRFRVALGKVPEGQKWAEGDNKTPEGKYYIDIKNPKSQFHLSLGISYPSKHDLARIKEAGGESPGGDIFIHGLKPQFEKLGPLHSVIDWTQGCVAVSNREIEAIYDLVVLGTPVEICP